MSLPTPYYDKDGITIYCADSLSLLRDLDTPIDALITDPPYASGARTEAAKASSGAMVRGQRWASKPIENDQMTTTGFIWMIRTMCYAALPNMVDGANLLCFIDWRQWPNLVGAVETTNLRVNGMVVWDKLSMGLGNGFRAQHELILHASKGTCNPTDKGTGNVLKVQAEDSGTVLNFTRDSNEFHPSPKPVDLMGKLIRVASPMNGLVVDPFMGSGSTVVAAKREGRRAIGIEISEEYCRIAVERLAQGVMDFGGVGQ